MGWGGLYQRRRRCQRTGSERQEYRYGKWQCQLRLRMRDTLLAQKRRAEGDRDVQDVLQDGARGVCEDGNLIEISSFV